jgi:DNA-binding transcriptional MerR regulator
MLFAMDTQTYSLDELATRSGIPGRTIRSYIQRDLLPGALTQGRGAQYSAEHLHRLLAIKRLRHANRDVSLDKLRVLLQQLLPEQIEQIADGSVQIGALVDTDPLGGPTSALDYANSMASDTSDPASIHFSLKDGKTPRHGRPRSPKGSPGQNNLEQLLEALSRVAGSKPIRGRSQSETWFRITVTPDIELAVRGEFGPEQLAVLHQIGDHFRHFLTKGVQS